MEDSCAAGWISQECSVSGQLTSLSMFSPMPDVTQQQTPPTTVGLKAEVQSPEASELQQNCDTAVRVTHPCYCRRGRTSQAGDNSQPRAASLLRLHGLPCPGPRCSATCTRPASAAHPQLPLWPQGPGTGGPQSALGALPCTTAGMGC